MATSNHLATFSKGIHCPCIFSFFVRKDSWTYLGKSKEIGVLLACQHAKEVRNSPISFLSMIVYYSSKQILMHVDLR